MKILINAYFLSRPYTGFGNYTIGLLKSLKKTKTLHKFYAMTPVEIDEDLRKSIEAEHLKLIIVPQNKFLPSVAAKWVWEQFSIPKIAKKYRCDLIHNYYPSTSIFTHIPQITTIHDVIPWVIKDYQNNIFVNLLRAFVKWSSHRAKKIITISNYSKHEIARIFSIAPEKISIIYCGFGEEFNKTISQSAKEEILQKYSIIVPYIFYIGGFDARKNVKKMIIAFSNIAHQINQKLVVAGGVFSPQKKIYADYFQLPNLIKNLGIEDKVQFIGKIPAEDLPVLYQNADLFLSPTLAEGFNIPLLESFASKTPVICHNETATAEISAESAYEIDCSSADNISEAIIKLLDDEKLRKSIIDRQFQRAKFFSWDTAISTILDIYDTIKLD
ncbi:MAG: glycosyltransferase WbpY [Candidatus Berkelbacteria bacterium Licking1014_85]|uniref:Glycosyltransferase WbpY n=1 Tax=Candidatus Berkelbacteria bacterium Licking1014_85 TaxID=2017148 RepID=A0A554LJU9_9BACT|nr:MAG: glycosyltransferase WbpY [Candidatus Berkelbacteria bacterium Licking1014_85]